MSAAGVMPVAVPASSNTETADRVAEAMEVISVAVQGRHLNEVDTCKLIEWVKTVRDGLRDTCRERRTRHKEQRTLAKTSCAAARPRRSNSAREQRAAQRAEAKQILGELREIRSRAKAERRIDKAVSHLWRLEGGGVPLPLLSLDTETFARSLEEAVGARAIKQLEQDDLYTVEQLGQLVAVSATLNAGLDDSLRVDEVPGVMTRCSLYEGEHLVVRLHLFPDMAETYVHNHQNNFASVCLYGSYTHTIWTVSSETDMTHYEYRRGGDGQLSAPQKKPGGLVPGNSYVHSTNKAYYLCKEAHHTVEAQGGDALQSGTLTLYVKGRESEGTGFVTRVLAQDDTFEAGEGVTDTAVEGEAKEEVLRQMSAMLRLAAAEQLRKRC